MVNDSTTILGKPPSSPMPSRSARRPQLDGNFPGNGSPSKGTGAVDEIPGSRPRAHFSDASTAEVSPDEVAGASPSSETTAVWERLSNECACQCDWGCASCEPEETAEWRRV